MLDPTAMFRMFWLLICAIAVTLCSMFNHMAHAYIPKGRVILEKVGRQHGRGSYTLSQEVSFRGENGPITVTEDWVIENGESMTVDVRGAGQRTAYVYKNNVRHFVDDKGVEQSVMVGNEFFEPVFFYRSWDNLAEFLVKEKVLVNKNLAREAVKRETKDFGYVADPFVRLSRTAGVVTFALGQPTPPDSPKAMPGMWIEQDRFLIRKIRLDSQAEISADDYAEFSGGLWFPKTRTISWGDQLVYIRTLKVSGTSLPPNTKEKLQPSGLKKRIDGKEVFTSAVVSEFYKRFR